MGVHTGAQRCEICSDQGFRCIATHISWNRQSN